MEQRETTSRGRMTFGDRLAMFKARTETCSHLKPAGKRDRAEVIKRILKSWSGLESLDVRKISR